jgi:hypothetical protein
MTVSDLIAFLQKQAPSAVVVLYDHCATVTPAVCRLGAGEVQPVELYCEDANGEMWFELAEDHLTSAGVRLPGVVLGSR